MGERPLTKLLWRCNRVLRLASWIVPRGQRAEWLREWVGPAENYFPPAQLVSWVP
jgi:hypothetical protein